MPSIALGVITRGTGGAADIGRTAAGKTGTSQEWRDAWFNGYTPHLATSVWMGHPAGQVSMSDVGGRPVTGGTYPAQVWAAFMRVASADAPPADFPGVPAQRPEQQWIGPAPGEVLDASAQLQQQPAGQSAPGAAAPRDKRGREDD